LGPQADAAGGDATALGRSGSDAADRRLDPAAEAGLVYTTDEEPGIRRVRKGKGFEYVGPDGRKITEPATLDRIRSLVIRGFPAILPASLTLIEKEEGKQEAAIDSEGAILGAIALVVYTAVVVVAVSALGVVASLAVALAAWLGVAVVLYLAGVLVFRREPSPP
jgi:hypothetical protein